MKNFTFTRAKLFSIFYVLAFIFISGTLFAQTTYDLSGTFEGVRKQFDQTKTSYIQEFQYRFDLEQKGDQVEGISTIYSANGDYAEVKIKGLVVGDKFYFEEYEVVDEIKANHKTWCYKMGVLQIVRKNDYLYLEGVTESFMTNLGWACTGGYTEIAKTVDTAPKESISESMVDISVNEMSVFPNPTVATTVVDYTISNNAKVSVEVFDINGKLIQTVFKGKQDKGTHQSKLDLSEATPGLYIVKLTVGKEVYSAQVIRSEA